jgi:adenylylsulfate kinase
MNSRSGRVIWLTGIAGSGKTTLGRRLVRHLGTQNVRCEFLDGDMVRDFFANDLGYTRNDRLLNIKRIAFAAKLLADHGITVVVANIAPYYEARDFIRKKISNYTQVYLKASLETVTQRKALYKKVQTDGVTHVIGIDDVYEVPRKPDIVVDTDRQGEEEAFQMVLGSLHQKGIFA